MVPPTPSTRHGHERRREILRIAVDVFGEAGFAGARIDEVARRGGIQRPSVLYHFPDKQALYTAAISDVVADIAERIRATEGKPTDRLEAIADAWVDFMIARPNAARLLLRQMIDANPIAIHELKTPVRGLLNSIQAAIDDRSASDVEKTFDATEFALILSSTSLVWIASRSAIEGALGLDTLAPQLIQRHRHTLHSLTRQLLSAVGPSPPAPASIAPEPPQARTEPRREDDP